jgi:hypothetical protein
MTEPSAFWDDLNRDLADPETAAEYAANRAAIRDYDQALNAAVRSLSSLDPGAVVLGRRIWECAVDELEDDYFGAQLKPVSGNAEEAEASFDYLQVSDIDRPLLQLGALFWLISEAVKCRSGHVEGRSMLWFRRVDDGMREAPSA